MIADLPGVGRVFSASLPRSDRQRTLERLEHDRRQDHPHVDWHGPARVARGELAAARAIGQEVLRRHDRRLVLPIPREVGQSLRSPPGMHAGQEWRLPISSGGIVTTRPLLANGESCVDRLMPLVQK